jgi:hypothetical protein
VNPRPLATLLLAPAIALARLAAGEAAPAAPAAAEEGLVERLKLETHGFASFGWLRTWGNNWLDDDTREGSSEFHEAALNVLARPLERLRLGAQLFTRDLGRYDNGRVSLDWAYADYRAADWLGIQAGRIKYPVGLYNEVLDVDAARTPVFLAPPIYALRSRDLFISTDGLKLYGLTGLGGLGALEYAAFAGDTPYSNQAGTATYFADLGLGDRIISVDADWIAGGMLHWHTPLPGLALRVTLADLHGFRVLGDSLAFGAVLDTRASDYFYGVASLLYESERVTLAAEYSRIRGHIDTSIAGTVVSSVDDNTEGAYLSATWHAHPRFDVYAAGEATFADAHDRDGAHSYALVLALACNPINHWSLKLEGRQVEGTLGIQPSDNPGGVSKHWQVLALKTTVDF